jgi:LuxR family maltose regulon positive regulatory protein
LTELRASDLRFTHPDAAEYLKGMGVNLSTEDVAVLDDRTEGWIAGLQLAALAMQSPGTQNSQDISGYIRAFAGDHRYIMDYLVEEVLQRQPEPVRNFLLQTSILDRLHGPLCAAVTGQADGSARLEALLRGNFFVIPLDDNRLWYRYHHLFADVLHANLLSEQPGQIAALHRRASEWYEQQGLAAGAIHHALAGEDFAHAADQIELAFPVMSRSRQEATLLDWLKALPEAIICNRPVLCNVYAGVLLQSGELEGVDAWLLAAEKWLRLREERGERPETPLVDMVVVDPDGFRRLPASVAMYRAGQALLLGNVVNTLQHARRALDLALEDDYLSRGGARALLGLVYWSNGDLEAAYGTYAAGMVDVQKAGYLSDTVAPAITLADIRIDQGRLGDALRTYEAGLQLAMRPGAPVLRGAADMHVGMSTLLYEHNDLHAAMQHLLKCKELGEHMGLPQNRYRWRVAMARMKETEGDLDGALNLLDEAERMYFSDFSPKLRPVPAIRARVWVRQGRLGEALDWARKQGLSVDDEVSYLHEFEYITLAWVLLAQYRRESASQTMRDVVGLLAQLLKAAEEGGRMGSVIEVLILQALAHQMQGDLSSDNPVPFAPLERALRLAEPEGYIRTFVNEGQPMLRLLRAAAGHGILPAYTIKLLSAFIVEQHGDAPGTSPLAYFPSQPLIEPLSQRELDVLRLFRTELSGPEIASHLVIGLSTMRSHTKSIYGKLNVNNRRAAIKRAEELALI